VINEGLSEIIGPFPVPSPRDKRERNDDPGQKRRGHRYSVHPSNHTISIDYRDRRSVNYLDHSHPRRGAEISALCPIKCQVRGMGFGTIPVGLDGPARSSRFGILRRTVSSHLRKIARLPAQLTDPCLIPDPRAAAPDQLASENEERERASQREAKALAWRERFRYDFLLTHGDNAPLTIRQSR
jgi:hypothetical protein